MSMGNRFLWVLVSFLSCPALVLAACGNGWVEDPEACDDGNVADGDGCSASCAFEPGFVCTGEPSECRCGGVSPGVPLFTDSGQALGDGFTWKALVGDIDNDGDPDIVALEDAYYKVQIYFNDGDGLFSFAASKSFQRATPHRSGALADLDGDANLDLVVGGDGGGAGVFLYRGDGTGAFAQVWSNTWSYAQIDAVKAGDIDGNGSVDLVVAGFISDEESIQACLNTGATTYTCIPVVSGISQATDVALVDLDNDSDHDLAVASLSFGPAGSEIRVFLNSGGVFTDTGQATTATYPFGLAAGDLDGDGDADLAVGNQASSSNQILLNDGTGTFADSGQLLGAEATNSVVVGDIDLDGDLDLIAMNEGHGGRGYVVYSNNGLGSFTEQEFGSNNFKHNGNLVDVDADMDLDLVTGDYATGASNNHAPDQVLFNNLMCTDDDECTLGTHDCDVNATCTNTPGSFTCACNSGYQGDGFVCTLIDLCPADPNKLEPGICGCGTQDTDTDGDGTADCEDGCPNDSNKITLGICGCGADDTIGFVGFLPPIGGADATGGTFADPLRAFKLGSTIPAKFAASQCGDPLLTGIHTLQAVKYSSAVDSDPAIDATPTDAATTGNQFRLTDGEWHFNLSTQTGFSQGTWKLIATLSDGSTHYAWITIKK
ncbi:MAG: FG-GAP-like repeat-containing protein [Planctomycetota bacterium]